MEKIDDHTLTFTRNGQRLKIAIDAPVPISVSEKKVDDCGNSFTRVAVYIPMQGHETVTLHFARLQ